jgi:S1-C subfamily serine protease
MFNLWQCFAKMECINLSSFRNKVMRPFGNNLLLFAAFGLVGCQTAPQFPIGFNCSRLTNDESRAHCRQELGQQDPITFPAPDSFRAPIATTCAKLTNDESRDRCFRQRGEVIPQLKQDVGAEPKSRRDEVAPKLVPPPNVGPTIVSTGTGFFVSEDGFAITNAHVVTGCTKIRARRPSGAEFDLQLIAFDAGLDLALLKGSKSGATALFRKGSPPLGEAIIVYGFPLVGTLSIAGNLTTGAISSLAGIGEDQSRIQITAPVQPGNSGGAVLDEAGNVVGVVQSKLNASRAQQINGDIPQNINFAIKGSVAQQFLLSKGVKVIEKNSNLSRKVSNVAESAMQFTVLLACLK